MEQDNNQLNDIVKLLVPMVPKFFEAMNPTNQMLKMMQLMNEFNRVNNNDPLPSSTPPAPLHTPEPVNGGSGGLDNDTMTRVIGLASDVFDFLKKPKNETVIANEKHQRETTEPMGETTVNETKARKDRVAEGLARIEAQIAEQVEPELLHKSLIDLIRIAGQENALSLFPEAMLALSGDRRGALEQFLSRFDDVDEDYLEHVLTYASEVM